MQDSRSIASAMGFIGKDAFSAEANRASGASGRCCVVILFFFTVLLYEMYATVPI